MRREEYEELKLKALDFISKAHLLEKMEEKLELLDKAEEIIGKLKSVIEDKRKIAYSKLLRNEMNLKTKNIIEAII